MDMLSYLIDLDRLAKIARGGKHTLNTTELERQFLAFSYSCEQKELLIRCPRQYQLKGTEHEHYAAALKKLGAQYPACPLTIDITGDNESVSLQDILVLLSPEQLQADHRTSLRSYLNPLLEKIFIEGAALIRDFALHEALCGKVLCKRGDLLLHEISRAPEAFKPGPYTLEVTLDTPASTVKNMKNLATRLAEFSRSPQEMLLHPLHVSTLAQQACELRALLGSLSRYEVPFTHTFTAPANTLVSQDAATTAFCLYQPEHNHNLLVYFGASPFSKPDEIPVHLPILDGADRHQTLLTLIDMDFYKPSKAVLEQRVIDYEALHAQAPVQSAVSAPDFSLLLDGLKKAHAYFEEVDSPLSLKRFALSQPAELLEFMLCPALDEPPLHELLPRLSWNAKLRLYHDTPHFINTFTSSDDATKAALINDIVANITFHHHHNNDVNTWLYTHHRARCEAAGVIAYVPEVFTTSLINSLYVIT